MKTKRHSAFCILPSSFAFLAVVMLCLTAPPALAQTGQWGIGTPCYVADPDDMVYAVAVQTDGKTIIGGIFKNVRGCLRNRIARLNADGSLDTTFDPGVHQATNDAGVLCLAVQTDGKILLGGYFTNVCGTARNNIARLNADGTIDPSFNAGANGTVQCLALQTNGQILVGGWFAKLGGETRANLARLNTNGTLDTSFTNGADNSVLSLAVQADQKILVGGAFNTLGGQSRTNIGRLNSNGSPDTSFTPAYPEPGGYVCSLALATDGQILVGGLFNTLGGQSRTNIGMLNSNGSLNSTFSPNAVYPRPFDNGSVASLMVQADEKIVVGGDFTTLCGHSRTSLGRLNPDGSLDNSFNPVAGGSFARVECLALQTNKILVGGWFTTLGGQSRNNLGRLMPEGGFDLSFNPPAIAGPVYPPPWGVTFNQSGEPNDDQIGRAAGKTWYFTNNTVPAGTIAFWGATNDGVKLSFDNSTYTGPEILTYRPDLSSLAGGKVVWAGQTLNPVSTNQTVYARFVLTVTNQATGAALPLFEAGSLRLPAQIGGLVLVTNNLLFKAVLRFQASFNVNGPFEPALDFFNTNIVQKPPGLSNSAYSSFGAGFYYLTNSFTLNRIVRLRSATDGVEVQFQTLPGYSNILECSTNLTAWRRVAGAVADGHGVVPFVDRAPPSGRAFYRVRSP